MPSGILVVPPAAIEAQPSAAATLSAQILRESQNCRHNVHMIGVGPEGS